MPKNDVAPFPALTVPSTNPTVHIPHICTCSCSGYNIANTHNNNVVPKTVDASDRSQSVTTITITITSTSPSPAPSTAPSISTTTTTPGNTVPVGGTTITIHTPGASSPVTVPSPAATITQRTNTTWASGVGSASTSPPMAPPAPTPLGSMGGSKKKGMVGYLGTGRVGTGTGKE